MEKEIKQKLDYYKTLSDKELFKELGLSPPEELDLQSVSSILDRVSSWDRQTLIYAFTIGDGSISPRGVLSIDHGFKQKAFVQFKYNCLKNAGFLAPRCKIARSVRYHEKTGKFHISWRFGTTSIFRPERNEFYPVKNKIIPTSLLEGLTPEILAFWYMDNGSQGSNTPMGMVLDVSPFSDSQKMLARNAISDKFDIDVTFHDQQNNDQVVIGTKLIKFQT